MSCLTIMTNDGFEVSAPTLNRSLVLFNTLRSHLKRARIIIDLLKFILIIHRALGRSERLSFIFTTELYFRICKHLFIDFHLLIEYSILKYIFKCTFIS